MGQLFPLPIPVRIVFLVSTYANYVHSSNGISSSRSNSTSLRTLKLSGVLSTALKCPVPFPPSLPRSLTRCRIPLPPYVTFTEAWYDRREDDECRGGKGGRVAKLRVNINMALRILFFGLVTLPGPFQSKYQAGFLGWYLSIFS